MSILGDAHEGVQEQRLLIGWRKVQVAPVRFSFSRCSRRSLARRILRIFVTRIEVRHGENLFYDCTKSEISDDHEEKVVVCLKFWVLYGTVLGQFTHSTQHHFTILYRAVQPPFERADAPPYYLLLLLLTANNSL